MLVDVGRRGVAPIADVRGRGDGAGSEESAELLGREDYRPRVRALWDCPRDGIFHAEGDVRIQAGMVCEAVCPPSSRIISRVCQHSAAAKRVIIKGE